MSTNKMMNPDSCTNCLKVKPLCICDAVVRISNDRHVFILQHPQEPDQALGSAKLAVLCLENAQLRVGLSVPNLSKALGRNVENGRWGVLYLGGKADFSKFRDEQVLWIKKGGVVSSASELELDGIVVLDGTWSQAKALWWRNPWLLKLKRLALNPKHKSLYKELRKEPRRECLSTIESIAEVLEGLGEKSENSDILRSRFQVLLDRYRKSKQV